MTPDRIAHINEATIKQELIERGLLDQRANYRIESAGRGFNNRVFVARRADSEPTLTIRVRWPDDRSPAEVDALSDVTGCPGAPRLQLLTHNLLVLDFLPGEPRDLAQLSDRQFAVLAQHLACVHSIEYTAFTPWPEPGLRAGSRADLLRFRVASLANYACYADARSGKAHAALPALMEQLATPNLTAPSWELAEFSRLHGDLSRGNLLWHGDELGLIDWEFSRVGDPAEDLAYVFTEQPDGIERLPQLAALYAAADGSTDVMARIPAYGLFTSVDSALWWIDYGRRHDRPVSEHIDLRIKSAQHWLSLDL